MNLELAAGKNFLGRAISKIFRPLSTETSIEWAADNVTLGMEVTSVKTGKFNALVFTALEYVYDCLDNPYIPVIYCIKSARFGWTTATIIWVSKVICESPRNILIGFGSKDAAQKFYKDQWASFISGIPRLLKSINIGVAASKVSWNHITYYGGSLRFVSTRIITNLKSTLVHIGIFEEIDNHTAEVNSEGDMLALFSERMKTVPVVLRKTIVGATGTIEGLSRIAKLMTTSNDMVFKAECHECKSLIPMDYRFFEYFRWATFEDKKEHKQFGKYNPKTAQWFCPNCECEWTFAQKNKNMLEGKKHGFFDHTGKFSKGWHPENPEITEIFGFRGSECMSPMKESNFEEMSKKILAAKFALSKGDESLMVTVFNNMYGWAYRTVRTTITAEILENFYSTYSPEAAPYEALIPYLGIDVQRNRLAFTIVVAGRNSTFYTLDWFEIFGEPCSFDSPLWEEASAVLEKGIQHVSGIKLNYNGIAIDCQDGITAEYVYSWVAQMQYRKFPVYAVRGVNNLRFSNDPIFALPVSSMAPSQKAQEKTLAESYGVIPYQMGTHACQSKVLLFLENGTKKELDGRLKATEVLYFTRYDREDFLEQMTGCVLVPFSFRGVSAFKWELPSGKRMEALACVKMCFWLATKDGIFNYTEGDWSRLDAALR